VRDGSGDTVAVLGVRLPVYRAARGVPQAGAALLRARPALERAAAAVSGSPRPLPRDPDPSPRTPPPRSLAAAFRMLEHLADGPDGAAGIAAAAGLRIDRTRRLLESCLRSGLVEQSDGGVEFRLSWLVHGWHRAAAHPALLADGRRYAAETAAVTGACVFLTVLKGLRSVTLVEELAVLGEGLVMRPWLGRPHPIIGSDGGPTLVMDLSAEELSEIFPAQHRGPEFDRLLDRVARVTRDQVISVESVEEFGITSVSAPVRDAAGAVVAAACIVGATEHVRPRRAEIEAEAQRLASRATALLV
jgi:DNA-binding IclR family transcriptional regulator